MRRRGYGRAASAALARLALAACVACAAASFARAQDADSAPPDATADERLQFMQRSAEVYRLELETDPPRSLSLHAEPLLRFDNAVSGVPDGIVILWRDGVRPAVFAQVFQTNEGLWIHECQSLAEAPLAMRRAEREVWAPREPGQPFGELSGAGPPAATAARRLTQMRSLANEFQAWDDFRIDAGDAETTRHVLRLLPKPIYRYADADAGLLDGAVFAFVHGTDPEVFLVFEARARAQGGAAWRYALAPMTCWSVRAEREMTPAWTVPERLGRSTPQTPYHVWQYRETE
jgi:hypothetical protein